MDYIGENLRLRIFGGSHEPAVGMTLSGFPAGEAIDAEALAAFLARRAPGRDEWASPRRETDIPDFLSGLTEGLSDGMPIRTVFPNRDARSADYAAHAAVPRPGHADYGAWLKDGAIPVGGGAFSGRMTAPLCLAGGICLQYLARRGVRVVARIRELGGIADEGELRADFRPGAFPTVDAARGEEMKAAIAAVKEEGDSLGGVVECAVFSLPAGLGGPLFEGLEGRIAAAVYAIPAVKGVEFGRGFDSARLRGSENNDAFCLENGRVVTATNNCGGILGGISDGMPLVFRAAFKPTSSIAKEQKSVDLDRMEETTIRVAGRHDACVVPRAVPCVEAAAALVLCDALLSRRSRGDELAALRARIDGVDEDLQRLFEERMALAGEIAAYKQARGLPVTAPGREAEKLLSVEARSGEGLADYDLALFRTLLELSKKRQRELRGEETE